MNTLNESKRFVKLPDWLMELKECKSGNFTSTRKVLISRLMYLHSTFYKNGEVKTHKKGTYHFYFVQKEFAMEIGKDESTINRAMNWLKNEGYITYFPGSKPRNIWQATYVTLNEKFINEKIGSEVEKIDNNSIPMIENIELIPVENIPTEAHKEIQQEKIFRKEHLERYLLSDKVLNFDDSIGSLGYKPEKPEYSDLVTAIWNYNNTLEQDDYSILKSIFSKIYTGKNEKRIYWTKIEDKINNSWFSQ